MDDDIAIERRPRRATGAFAVFTVAMIVVMVFPVYALGNRIEPFVLGLPWSLFWVVGWIAVEFVVMIAFFLYEHGGGRD